MQTYIQLVTFIYSSVAPRGRTVYPVRRSNIQSDKIPRTQISISSPIIALSPTPDCSHLWARRICSRSFPWGFSILKTQGPQASHANRGAVLSHLVEIPGIMCIIKGHLSSRQLRHSTTIKLPFSDAYVGMALHYHPYFASTWHHQAVSNVIRELPSSCRLRLDHQGWYGTFLAFDPFA